MDEMVQGIFWLYFQLSCSVNILISLLNYFQIRVCQSNTYKVRLCLENTELVKTGTAFLTLVQISCVLCIRVKCISISIQVKTLNIQLLTFSNTRLLHHMCTNAEPSEVKMMLPFSSLGFRRSSGSMCTSCRIRGRRVTMPVPRGRMSLPTRLSKTELFPLLCREEQHHIQNSPKYECLINLWLITHTAVTLTAFDTTSKVLALFQYLGSRNNLRIFKCVSIRGAGVKLSPGHEMFSPQRLYF